MEASRKNIVYEWKENQYLASQIISIISIFDSRT